MNNITAVIVVKGSPKHLDETIGSIELFCDEILIGDIGMADRVKQRMRDREKDRGGRREGGKIRIIEIKEDVPYVELIREKLHAQVKTEYIVVLDPDESIPSKLVDALKTSVGEYDYVKIPRKNIIFGKWIEHSQWWPDYQVRFFRKNKVKWPTSIHTQPITSGKELILEPKEELAIVHHNYEDLDEYILKAPRYAKAQANEDIADDEPSTFAHYAKQALAQFVSKYFAHEGYKDGMHGFVLAFLQMMYYFLVYFYVLEDRKFENTHSENMIKNFLQFLSSSLYEISFWGRQKGLIKISLMKVKLQKIIHKL